jgi:GTP-binding protein
LNVPPQDSDKRLLEFLRSAGRPFVMVGTKADKLSGNHLRNSLNAFAQDFPGLRIVPYSARTGLGRDDLWREIRTAAESPGTPDQRAFA